MYLRVPKRSVSFIKLQGLNCERLENRIAIYEHLRGVFGISTCPMADYCLRDACAVNLARAAVEVETANSAENLLVVDD